MMMGGGPGGGGMHWRRGMDQEEVNLSWKDLRSVLRLWVYIRPYKFQIVASAILVSVVSLTRLVGPYLMAIAIDQHIAQGNLRGLDVVALMYLAAYLVAWGGGYAQTYIMSWVGQRIIYTLRKDLFAHLQRLGLNYYDRLQAGRIMSRVTNDVESLNQLVSSGIISFVNDFVTIFGVVAAMLALNRQLAMASFITVPMLAGLTIFFQGRMRRAYHQVRRRIADVNANLQESISGMRVTQAFTREDVNVQRFDSTNQGNLQANLQAAALHSLFFPLVEVIGATAACAVVWYGGVLYARNVQGIPTGMTAGVLAAFIGYVVRFFMPIRNLSQLYNMFLSASVSTERIFEMLDEVPEIADRPGAIALPVIEGRVRFEDVTFSYVEGQPVLFDLNLQAEPGEIIALVGPTGAGKSTVINLLSRFYEPEQGRITVDGVDIRDCTLESLRSQLGIVLQDTFLFSGTIRDNLRYGKLSATDAEIYDAAEAVGAHEYILRLPDGYDTQVHERGGRLSVGQRQLLAFARALIADPRILILDEATSSVDAYTEVLIQRAMERMLQGRTSFVIAHRLSTIRHATRIYVLDQGRVVESGTHEELLARGGLYRELYEKQFAQPPTEEEVQEAKSRAPVEPEEDFPMPASRGKARELLGKMSPQQLEDAMRKWRGASSPGRKNPLV